jgi:hypothetical protein
MWFLRPSAPATILQSYDQNISYLSGKPAQNIGHKRFFSTSAASIASNYIIPPADLPRAFAVSNLAGSANHDNRRKIMTMRKMIYLVGAVAIAVVATGYVWSWAAVPSNARVPSTSQGIEPIQLMMNAKGLPTAEVYDHGFVFH